MVGPARYKVLDIAADGRVLIGHEREERVVEALMAGSSAPVEVGLRASSAGWWIAPDGTSVLIADQSTSSYETYLLKAGDTTPVHLGPGNAIALSPDGAWALGLPVEGYPIFVHPTGAGKSRTLPDPESILYNLVGWLTPHISSVSVRRAARSSRGYVQDINGGPPRPFTPAGVTANVARWWSLPISPDGARVIAADEHGTAMIYRVDGGAANPSPISRPATSWCSGRLTDAGCLSHTAAAFRGSWSGSI